MFPTLKKYMNPRSMCVVFFVVVGISLYLYSSEMSLNWFMAPAVPAKEGLHNSPLSSNNVLANAAPVTVVESVKNASDPTALLPRDPNTGWAISHPTTEGGKKMNLDLFKYGKDWGVNSIVVPRRNNNISGRIDPVIPEVPTGIWNQAPDRERDPYESGFNIEASSIPGYKS